MLRDISQDPTTARTLQGAGHVEIQNISRRGFLGVSGTAFALALFPAPVQAFTRFKVGGSSMPQGLREDPLLFVSLTADGLVTVIVHRSEMGQGIRTSFAMVIADELGADWAQMRVRQAPGDEPKYGNQDTDGSRSMRHHIQALRYMGAAMRQMLINAAAAEWGVDASQVSAGVNEIKSASRSATFGELAAGAMQQPVPRFEDLTFKTEEQFRYIGKGSILAIDLDDIVTGKAVYGADVALAGMKYAVIARPPVIGAKVLSYDSEAALEVPGVERILMIPVNDLPIGFAPLGGIAVIAAHTDAAIKGRDALVINWGDSRHDGYDSEAFTAEMRATAKKPGKVIRAEGQPKVAFEKAARVFGREYGQAHMAHAPMEPPVAVADVRNGKAEIWGPLQSPYRARQEIAKIIGLDVENVTVNVTLLGGGFGRKSVPDFAAEAAILSQKVGAPIKVQWTREDDIQHSMYHTTAVERLEVALDADNQVTGWRHNSVAPSLLSTFAPDSGHQFFIEHVQGHVDMPFDIPHVSIENGPALAHTRIGWFQSVSNVQRAWAVQTFISELAAELGQDELDLQLRLLGADRHLQPSKQGFPKDFWNYGEDGEAYPIDTKRIKNVLRRAAKEAGWGRPMPTGEGLGLAVHRSFVSYVASCVHVKIVDGQVTVPTVHTAIDCGFAANPERIRSQVEGSAVMGMTLALHSKVTYENGAATQSNFHDYEMVRADNFPQKVHTHIIQQPFSAPPGGVGEPAVPPFAPALGNAIFHATGKRLRDLPFGDTLEL